MTVQPQFTLQFAPSQIDGLVERYGPTQDDEALEAGRQIALGHYDRRYLKTIATWKSPRRAALINNNADPEITVALKFATAADTPERLAVTVLTALDGVGIPMASAILTAVNPDKYTVLDTRALESLGITNWPDSVAFYLEYLNACRELAVRHGTTLRNLDRALWQWSWEESRNKAEDK